jgi:hypothetical protein
MPRWCAGFCAEAAVELRGLADRLTRHGALPRAAPTAIEGTKIDERRLVRIPVRDRSVPAARAVLVRA